MVARVDERRLAELQDNCLLPEAERLLGPRARTWTILPPVFSSEEDCPYTDFPNGYETGTAQAKIGTSAEESEDLALFQLGHETVHLLNPVLRCKSTWLEEGVAVGFSCHVVRLYGNGPVNIANPKYEQALSLVRKLESPLDAGRRVREMYGSLSSREMTMEGLRSLYPTTQVDDQTLANLCKSFQNENLTD